MPHLSTPDYYPAGILCPGGHCEGSANPHWCWISDLCPFGFKKPATSWVADSVGYRYGFNSQEKDDEIYGSGNSYTAEYWQYDARLGRRWNLDPVDKPWMSSYHAFSNKPILNIDPNGAFDDNYTIFSDGTIFKEETNDPTNTYTYIDNAGNSLDLGTYNVVNNSKGEDMVQAGVGANGSNDMFSWSNITSGNMYFEEDAFAALLGGIQDFYGSSFQIPMKSPDKVQINQFMSLDRRHSDPKENRPLRNSAIDIAFYRDNRTTGALTTDSDISQSLNLTLLGSMKKFGLGSERALSSTSEYSTTPFFDGTTGAREHHHHFHLDGFDGSKIENVGHTLPTVTIFGFRYSSWIR